MKFKKNRTARNASDTHRTPSTPHFTSAVTDIPGGYAITGKTLDLLQANAAKAGKSPEAFFVEAVERYFRPDLETQLRETGDAWSRHECAAREKRKADFNSMDVAVSLEEGAFCEAIGFKEGVLVWYNGEEITPITPRDAMEWLADMAHCTQRLRLESLQWGEPASGELFKQVAEAMQEA